MVCDVRLPVDRNFDHTHAPKADRGRQGTAKPRRIRDTLVTEPIQRGSRRQREAMRQCEELAEVNALTVLCDREKREDAAAVVVQEGEIARQ